MGDTVLVRPCYGCAFFDRDVGGAKGEVLDGDAAAIYRCAGVITVAHIAHGARVVIVDDPNGSTGDDYNGYNYACNHCLIHK